MNNTEKSVAAEIFIGWLDMWFMPLFFLLSGIGSWYALKSRTNEQYLWERVKRLLIPLYTAGLCVLLPPMFYFEIVSNHKFTGTFWASVPLYLREIGNLSIKWPGGLLPLDFTGHLWFLKFLFVISLLALPLLRYLRSEQGERIIDRLAGWCEYPGGIFFFLLPVIIVRVGLRSAFHGEHTWADLFEFIIYFIFGYLLPTDERFTTSIKRLGRFGLLIGLAAFGVEGIFVMGLHYNYPGGEPFSITFVLFEIVMAVGRWSWMVYVLYFGVLFLNFQHKLLVYASEAVLPFYLLHETIILCVGWFVIRRDIGILPKYLIIVVTSFILTMALYEFLIRRFNVIRLFFGMRSKK